MDVRNVGAGILIAIFVLTPYVLSGIWIIRRSYRRNTRLYGRSTPWSVVIALGALWLWPLTLLWWLVGPTPERRARWKARRLTRTGPVGPPQGA